MVTETVDHLSGGEVPQLNSVIVGTRSNQSLIGRKRTRPDPVVVRINRKEEFTIGYLMNLEGLVV